MVRFFLSHSGNYIMEIIIIIWWKGHTFDASGFSPVSLLNLNIILFLQISYISENVVEGKKKAKEALQQRLGLKRADLPLIGIITRLTHQKGIHLIKHAIWRTLDRGGQVILFLSICFPCLFLQICALCPSLSEYSTENVFDHSEGMILFIH